ncbi:hypothetical protein GA830_09575 [Mesorhizobium sp. NBSH29]|nr:hypothetical protein [Mesorhizobium sp. NBSH29]QPC88633.1 hypothetical protein GA830_09575 [Mesorhizobium sp. NBSH29]
MQSSYARGDVATPSESSKPAINWGPIIAGALAASTVTIVLIMLGAGLGLTAVSPWSGQSSTLATLATATAVWLVVVQWLSSAIGGYLAGRLRTRWVNVHTDEVYFRDTAHGFLVWALATVLVVGLFSSAISSALGTGVKAASTVAAAPVLGAAANLTDAAQDEGLGYLVDGMFRPADPSRLGTAGDNASATAEASRIVVASIAAGEMTTEDRTYVAQLVASRSGISQPDAEARVDAALAKAQQMKVEAQEAADTARKASMTFALLTALSMAIGAFIASAAALLGGMQRDEDDDRLHAVG